ncbi:Gfo/Idh/MocA family protein [Paenibacillus sp. GCM10028914]|uniref:Gfo/Idh/MocA family protein n=1 Tax=Paenibacillus sp. GCM10028914 TaxID=3273416 RepID=UPI00362421B3
MTIKAILIGAGVRGANVYAPYARNHPEQLQFAAVAEPDPIRRSSFAIDYDIPNEHVYEDWRDVLRKPRFADAVWICTQDRMHFEVAMAALQQGYHVLLEKPISPSPLECLELEETARKSNRLLTICHVLRYTPFWSGIHKIVENGDIGKVVDIQLRENIGYAHMAHSYVRGKWNKAETASPMILAKSCHDLDLISWIMDEECTRLSSFGSLLHFRKDQAPEGATERCSDGCPHVNSCCYVDYRYYMGEGRRRAQHFSDDLSDSMIRNLLPHTPYGRCVYHCDNDVVDHQNVNLQFRNGATASFSLSAFTHDSSRTVQISGTRGEIRGNMANQSFTVYSFADGGSTDIQVEDGGREGTDRMLQEFCDQVQLFTGNSLTSASASLQSHMMAFAAEESRLGDGQCLELSQLVTRYREVLNSGLNIAGKDGMNSFCTV